MKKLFITSIASILMILSGFAQTVTTTVAIVNGTPGQIASVPVTVAGIDGNGSGTAIIGFQIYVQYQTSIVTYLESINLNASLAAVGTYVVSTANNGNMTVNWLANDVQVPGSVTDGDILFDIRFVANNGGTSPLTLNNVEYYDINNNTLTNNLSNGSITFGTPASSTTWNGTGTWYTAGNWSNGVPGSATQAIINSGVVTIDAAAGYSNNLTVNPGAGVTLNTGKTLSITGNLVLESNATSTATGSLLNNGTLSVSGTITAKRYLTGATQHFISIPVTAATIQNLINPSNPGYFFRFIEPSGTWENPWQPTFQLSLGVGYSVNYNGPQTISLNGALNNDSQYQPTLTRSGAGWNLAGNPYACPLDWNNASGWTKTNLDNAIYIWNNNAYASYVNGVGTNGGTQYIPQFQGFFVHANAALPAIAIKKAARTQSGNSTPFLKDEIANVFKMSISNGSLGDQMAVYMFDGATQEFDSEYDAYKLFGFNLDAPHIYTTTNDVEYAINGLPMMETISLPVVVNTNAGGEFSFTAEGFGSFGDSWFFFLEDKETGSSFDLRKNPVLNLTVSAGATAERFNLRIFKSALGIGDDLMNNTRIYAENKQVIIENCPKSDVVIYNLTGAIVAESRMEEASLNSISINVPSGIYIVKLISSEGTVTSKVYIK
jgi:fibronectin-binding autotransporter adhesin